MDEFDLLEKDNYQKIKNACKIADSFVLHISLPFFRKMLIERFESTCSCSRLASSSSRSFRFLSLSSNSFSLALKKSSFATASHSSSPFFFFFFLPKCFWSIYTEITVLIVCQVYLYVDYLSSVLNLTLCNCYILNMMIMYYSKIAFIGISISKKIPKNSNLYRYYFVEY